jgi:NHLM bacteriocin system ABC transporter ATP-binding protein
VGGPRRTHIPSTQDVLLRIVSTAAPGRQAEETIPLSGDAATIGRADDCTIVLQDGSVSRHHAVVEATPAGYRLRDTGSANGVFVAEARVREAPLAHGTRFRVGATLFEFVAPPPPPPPAPPAAFVLRIAASKAPGAAGREFTVSGIVSVGRGDDCTIPLKDNSCSRHHATIQLEGEGFRVTDTASANGVWLEDRRIASEVLAAGQRFRIGDTYLECSPKVVDAETEHTLVMADLGQLMAKVAARRLSDLGESVSLSGAQAMLLDDPAWAYYVVSGKVEVFTVGVKDGRPSGARAHFLTVPEGEALFGMDPQPGGDSAFLASAKTDARIRRIPREALLELAEDQETAAEIVRIIDAWIVRLSRRLVVDIRNRPAADLAFDAGTRADLAPGRRARASSGVAWVDAEPDALLYIGMATLPGDGSGAPCAFPLTPDSWVEPASDQGSPLAFEPRGTAALVTRADVFWPGLDAFHRALCECEFLNKRLALVDEFDRLQSKARQSEAARDAAMDALGAVMAGQTEAVRMAAVGSAKPLLEACRLVAAHQGHTVSPPGDSRTERTLDEQVLAIAAASRFRTRQVALRGEWWKGDQGPMLAVIAQTNSPVALLPKTVRSYECAEPATGETRPVTRELADSLQPLAYTFYRPLPAEKLGVRDLIRIGVRGLAPDFRLLGVMGVVTGLLGALTPYLTGRMVDDAIPQGDRSLLMQLGLAMFLLAIANSAFRITQSVTMLRINTRLSHVLGSGVWDRLLDLPSGFFRQYGAGDLAERAGGINTIRGLISQAGVTAILSALSSVFYLVLMLTYSVQLTMVAILISLVLVAVTTAGNYWQLTHQRKQGGERGKIMSLVLQLIAGVAKVRVCAAENHAFKVWAQQFSTLKRTAFVIGRVQISIGTFTSAFSVLSSLTIFVTLYMLQSSGGVRPFTTGTFIAFTGAFGAFAGGLQTLSDVSLSLLAAVPTYERLKPILETLPETDGTKASPGKLRGEIAVSHLSFRYGLDAPWVIKDVSFSIRPGEFVAFVGASGCGKSTMLRLLLGFERPQSGGVYYDGQDLSSLDVRAVRQQLGVVLQESRLLPTDIFRNIVGSSARTIDDAWEAAAMAGLADDVKQMPMGMHTVVSEGGGTFSGGQRQRLLIARALVNRPKVIFFDEATSALDNRAQAVVTQSMDRMDATRIVIAHRLSTIVNADRIFYFEGGEIKEQGTYKELLAQGGAFAALARRQIA